MHYISHINDTLLLPMTYKTYSFVASMLFLVSACVTTPFMELNSRNNFQLEPASEFQISLNKDNLPVEMDPILIENLGEAAQNYLSGMGHIASSDASLVIEIGLASKEKLKLMISAFMVIRCIGIICMILIVSMQFQSFI